MKGQEDENTQKVQSQFLSEFILFQKSLGCLRRLQVRSGLELSHQEFMRR